MLFDDTYQTLRNISEGVFRDKGSKFIGYAYPINDDKLVKSILIDLKAEHSKARHFCWALRLGTDRTNFRINDDGEPSGTAGRPILNTLLAAGITNVLIVVVRYFGGTLLGVPGLINAYKNASIEAIKANEIIVKTVNDIYEIQFGYLLMNEVMRIVKDEQLIIVKQEFDTNCLMHVEVRKGNLNIVLGKFDKLDHVEVKYLYTS
ncbi:IMPACT family protein [Pedobacter insulae]|uniref:Uncharacterized protein, YigZ family n=1 Tax=Pedobacter insulae TaxID=414048 RepID=A0A1I3AL16_9SPHI|nr:YigZ family protein [Pedobacter insulae]SFH50506.1 uncharacterized protein, YigZ family [Pedobacter insulae]